MNATVIPLPTEEDFEKFVVDRMSRSGAINTRMLYDALYPIRFRLEFYLGSSKKANEKLEEWIGKYLEPMYPEMLAISPDSILNKHFTWRLKINNEHK